MSEKFLMKYDELATTLVNEIPEEEFKSKTSTFFDPSMGSGQVVVKIEQKLKEYGHSESNISKRVFGFEIGKWEVTVARRKHNLLGDYKYEGNVFDMKKVFDNVITNPPYVGKAQLHQKFFNKSVNEWCKPNGNVVFIQPATPYQNQKKPRQHEAEMIENILNHKTDVKILDANIFKGADIGNDLAITVLHKVKDTSGKLNSITYKNGNKYENVDLNNVSMTQINPDIFSTIKSKYENYITNNGSLQDKTYYKLNNPKNNIAGLPKIRGHMGQSDMYTFQPSDITNTQYYTTNISEKHDFGIEVENNKQIKNVYSYLMTHVSRFGLSILKNNPNNHMGEFGKVPLIDFNKKWTDEMLIKELGLTQKEFKIIVKTLGDYHGQLATN